MTGLPTSIFEFVADVLVFKCQRAKLWKARFVLIKARPLGLAGAKRAPSVQACHGQRKAGVILFAMLTIANGA